VWRRFSGEPIITADLTKRQITIRLPVCGNFHYLFPQGGERCGNVPERPISAAANYAGIERMTAPAQVMSRRSVVTEVTASVQVMSRRSVVTEARAEKTSA
jgi:hypothetical protein